MEVNRKGPGSGSGGPDGRSNGRRVQVGMLADNEGRRVAHYFPPTFVRVTGVAEVLRPGLKDRDRFFSEGGGYRGPLAPRWTQNFPPSTYVRDLSRFSTKRPRRSVS